MGELLGFNLAKRGMASVQYGRLVATPEGKRKVAELRKTMLVRQIQARAKTRSAYFKEHRKNPERMKNYSLISPVASSVLYAVRKGKVFVFTAQRNPAETKTWQNARVLGATGKVEAGETGWQTMTRELNEELGLDKLTRKRSNPVQTVESIADLKFANTTGQPNNYLKGFSYLIRVDYATLQKLVQKMKQATGKPELINPKLVPLEQISSPNMQPHYELITEKVKEALRKKAH